MLPFLDLTDTQDHGYVADGLTEELTKTLARIPALLVVARTSAFSYKGKLADVRKIGAELNAAMVVEGSVRREGDKVRISVQLINSADGYHAWSSGYTRSLREVFSLPPEIADGILRVLRIKAAEPQAAAAGAHSHQGLDFYWKGISEARKWTTPGLRAAIGHLEQATRLAPRHAPAYAELANCYCVLGVHGGVPPREVMPKAKAAAMQAIALDNRFGQAHAALGLVKAAYEWDWSGAGREFQRALELDRGNTETLQGYALGYLAPRGRLEEAQAQMERAQALDPMSPRVASALGLVHYYRRQYDAASSQFRRALQLDSQFEVAYLALGSVYEQRGLYDEAIDHWKSTSPARIRQLFMRAWARPRPRWTGLRKRANSGHPLWRCSR